MAAPRAPKRRDVPPKITYRTVGDADKRQALLEELAKAERAHYAAVTRLALLKAQTHADAAGKSAVLARQNDVIRNAAELVVKLQALLDEFGPDEESEAE